MKLYVIATRDIRTDSFGKPIYSAHLGSAIRAFEDQITGKTPNGDPDLVNHPEDFELYQLGKYDDATGEHINEKLQLAVGANYARMAVQQNNATGTAVSGHMPMLHDRQ